MSFVDPSLRTLENNSIPVIHVALVNDQQQLLILITRAQHFLCLKFKVIFLNVPPTLSLHHHFHPEIHCSPGWHALPPTDLNFIHNSTADLDFCAASDYTSAVHARDNTCISKILIWTWFGDIWKFSEAHSETPVKAKRYYTLPT